MPVGCHPARRGIDLRVTRLTCQETFRRLDDYLDRELSVEEASAVEAHLRECEMCMREYAFEGTLLQGIRQKLQRLAAPSDLGARIAARIARDGDGTAPR
jgi:anti-sigma factor (TIGR02949 family)